MSQYCVREIETERERQRERVCILCVHVPVHVCACVCVRAARTCERASERHFFAHSDPHGAAIFTDDGRFHAGMLSGTE